MSKNKIINLWNQKDQRFNIELFSTNLPTLILNNNYKIIDWNAAFDIVFAHSSQITIGDDLTNWYDILDNFKSVIKNKIKRSGKRRLDLEDRIRVTFISPKYGRMVFMKIMTPIIDQVNGSILGWVIVLNLNSVSKRSLFVRELYKVIDKDIRNQRYAASYNYVYKNYKPHRKYIDKHLKTIRDKIANASQNNYKILDFGAGTGLMSYNLLKEGYTVHAIEEEKYMARYCNRLKFDFESSFSLNYNDLDNIDNISSATYDFIILNTNIDKLYNINQNLQDIYRILKPTGTLSITTYNYPISVTDLFNSIRTRLEEKGLLNKLTEQIDIVEKHENKIYERYPKRLLTREQLRAQLLENSFNIIEETKFNYDVESMHLICQKRL